MEALADIIIRPKRANYNSNRDFGPKQFYVGGKSKQRIDFDLTNTFSQKLKCSLFAPSNPTNKYPCVIYCHGNSGCRTEALEAVDLLLPHNIIVATLDFSGSGLSGGKFVTLGYNEQEDLKCLVNHLRTIPYISEIGLWGKGMGASTCIMYASTDPSISAMCLDSAFASLTQLCTDTLRSKVKFTLGTLVGGMFLASMKKIIQKKANFDIEEVSPISCLPQCRMPALLLHGIKDKTVPITHFRMLSMKYPGSSKGHEINIDHDEPRPKWLKQEIKTFFIQKFTEARKKQEFKNQMNLALNQKLDNPNIDHQKMEEIFNKLVDGQPDPSPSCITNTEPSSSQDLSERKKGTMTRSYSSQRLRSNKTSMNTLQLSTGTPSPFTLPDEKYKAATTKNRDISHVKLSFLLNSGGDRQDSPKVDLRAHKQFLKKSFK